MSTLTPESNAFWAAQVNWLGSAEANATAGPPSGSLGAKRARWELRGEKYMRNTGIKNANQLVRPDPALQRAVVDLIEAVAPAVVRAYDKHLGPLAAEALERWPVASGLSKSLLSLEYTTGSDGLTFKGRIVSRAPYSIFIRASTKTEAEKRKAQEKAAAIRAAAEKAGKLDRLGAGLEAGGGAGGNRGRGPTVVKKLLDDPAKQVPARILDSLEVNP